VQRVTKPSISAIVDYYKWFDSEFDCDLTLDQTSNNVNFQCILLISIQLIFMKKDHSLISRYNEINKKFNFIYDQ